VVPPLGTLGGNPAIFSICLQAQLSLCVTLFYQICRFHSYADYIGNLVFWSSRAVIAEDPALIEFHRLVEQEIPRLRRYARALTRNADRADDLVQETLTRAIDKAHLWQTGTDIRAWLFTIMHNQNVNMVRRAIRDEAGIDIQQISASLVATTDPTASRQLYELDRALACLCDEQRQVILLVGLEGMSYEDTAAILSVPVGTVRSRLSRGRDMLRSLLDMPNRGRHGPVEDDNRLAPAA
jgi:RNA polymerase sigma-70 factor (ECF subfamily)